MHRRQLARQTLLAIQQTIESGDLAAASHQIEDAVAQHPADPGLLNLRGVVHARRNEIPAARKDFAEAVRLAPTLTPAWENLARACQLAAEQDRSSAQCAIDAWRRVERFMPQDSEAHTSLALLFQRRHAYSDSLAELAKLPHEDVESTTSLAIRCLDLCELGRIAEAKSAASLLGSHSDFSDADLAAMHGALDAPKCAGVLAALIQPLDTRQAASPASLQRLAIAYEALGRTQDARKVLERVAIQDPTNTAHLLELARLAEITKDHEGALGYLGHARELAPGNPRIHFLFGLITAEMDLPVEARQSFDRALALDPDNPDYNYAMGSVILKTRAPGDSIPYFQKVVKAKSSDVRSHYALGIAYFAAGDYESSEKEMQPLERDPKAAAGAEYFLGRIARIEGHVEIAEDHLRKSIARMPNFSEAHTEMARVWLGQGKLEEARAELNRALALDPRSFQANAQLLALYQRTHDARKDQQSELLKNLDEERSKRAELMLRSIEIRP